VDGDNRLTHCRPRCRTLFCDQVFQDISTGPGSSRTLLCFPSEKATLIGGSPQISPDGTRLVYVASGADGKRAIWTRRLDSLNAELLPGTEEPANPFWSPDGRPVGFFSAGSKLEKIEFNGGPAQVLTGVQGNAGGTWNHEELFSSREVSMRASIVFPPLAARPFQLQRLMNRERRQATYGHPSCPTAHIFCFWRGAHKERTLISTPAAWIHKNESSS
jgi:WD40-like Beta Propeller Repeat